MSVVEDVRNALQDFLTPELRELKARLDAVELQVQKLDGAMQDQFQQVERRAQQRHEDMMFVLRQGLEVRSLAERLAAIEEKLRARHTDHYPLPTCLHTLAHISDKRFIFQIVQIDFNVRQCALDRGVRQRDANRQIRCHLRIGYGPQRLHNLPYF